MGHDGAAVRVVVVAGDVLARAGLVAILEAKARIEVAVSATPGDAPALIDAASPHVVVWDLGWDAEQWLEDLESVAAGGSRVVALVPGGADTGDVSGAGARGVVSREADVETLVAAIVAVDRGLYVGEGPLGGGGTDDGGETAGLTPREAEVLALVAQGLANKQIARDLGVSEHTVKFHVNALLAKLDARSRTEAVAVAIRRGLLRL